MKSQLICAGLALILAPVPALVAYAEEPAAAAVRDAGRAAAAGLGAGQAAKKADDKARAAQDAVNKQLPAVVAARRSVEIAQGRASSGKKEDLDRLKKAQERLQKAESRFGELQKEAIARNQVAEKARAQAAAAAKAADGAIGGAQKAIDQMENKPIEKRDLQRDLDGIKERWAKK